MGFKHHLNLKFKDLYSSHQRMEECNTKHPKQASSINSSTKPASSNNHININTGSSTRCSRVLCQIMNTECTCHQATFMGMSRRHSKKRLHTRNQKIVKSPLIFTNIKKTSLIKLLMTANFNKHNTTTKFSCATIGMRNTREMRK